jgi:hypothetical protein
MHTPTPWAAKQDLATGRWYIEIREDGYKAPIVFPGICGNPEHIGGPRFQGDAGDNAKFIALACNCHDDLLAACKYAAEFCTCARSAEEMQTIGKRLNAAISEAEGRS